MVGVSVLVAAKLALYEAMRGAGVTREELARRLGWRKTQLARVLDLAHTSRIEQIEAALRVLGKRLDIRLLTAA